MSVEELARLERIFSLSMAQLERAGQDVEEDDECSHCRAHLTDALEAIKNALDAIHGEINVH